MKLRDKKTGRILPVKIDKTQEEQIIKWMEQFNKNVVICLIELNYSVSKPTALKLFRIVASTI